MAELRKSDPVIVPYKGGYDAAISTAGEPGSVMLVCRLTAGYTNVAED